MKKILKCLAILLLLFNVVNAETVYSTYYELAEDFIGEPGDCYVMATKYLRALYDDDDFTIGPIKDKYEEVDYKDAKPGDVIFYSWMKSHVGITTHWAIYLGDGEAFHGNWSGYAVIDKAYLSFGAEPKFFHLKTSETVEVDFTLIALN